MKELQVKLIAAILIVVGVGLSAYKVVDLGFPLQPVGETDVWTVEARVAFEAEGGPVKVRFYIPQAPPGLAVLHEDFVSSEYGLATEEKNDTREALWAVRDARGKQALYYRIRLLPDPDLKVLRTSSRPPRLHEPEFSESQRSAVSALLERARRESADVPSFTRELLLQLNDPAPEENIHLLQEDIDDPDAWVPTIIDVLASAGVPARVVNLLPLRDGTRHGILVPWLEVYDEHEWIAFNPYTGASGFPPDSLVWHVGVRPMVSLSGGRRVEAEFSIAKQTEPLVTVAQRRAEVAGSAVLDYSLFSLPLQTQNVYRVLLLVPLGAFVIVLLRNVIGIKTFGTFMPVLIALAFRETELLWGILLFTVLVALALVLRLYLENLKLLLVPRLTAVLIIVILLMAGVSIVTHKLGLERGLSVALFPMVILTMTIERMSLLWEEFGPGEALLQGLGTLAVAIAGYLVMSNAQLDYVVFVFPELLLVLLALTLLMGRYTGYRLVELWRFRAMFSGGRQP